MCDHYWTEDPGYGHSTRHCYQLLATVPRCVFVHTHSLNVNSLQLILDVNVFCLILDEGHWNGVVEKMDICLYCTTGTDSHPI